MIIAICDNEITQRKNIQNKCEQYSKQNGVALKIIEFASEKEILRYQGETIAILFLDLELSDKDGIQVREQLETFNLVWRIVFVSGHPEKVFSAFGRKTLDFGLKPVKEEQVQKWLNIALEEVQEDAIVKFEEKNKDTWFKASQILYIKAAGNYIVVHTSCGECSITRNIKYWEEKLDKRKFIRTHKSYLVNVEHIRKIREEIEMDTDVTVAIGRKYRNETVKAYDNYIQSKIKGRVI